MIIAKILISLVTYVAFVFIVVMLCLMYQGEPVPVMVCSAMIFAVFAFGLIFVWEDEIWKTK